MGQGSSTPDADGASSDSDAASPERTLQTSRSPTSNSSLTSSSNSNSDNAIQGKAADAKHAPKRISSVARKLLVEQEQNEPNEEQQQQRSSSIRGKIKGGLEESWAQLPSVRVPSFFRRRATTSTNNVTLIPANNSNNTTAAVDGTDAAKTLPTVPSVTKPTKEIDATEFRDMLHDIEELLVMQAESESTVENLLQENLNYRQENSKLKADNSKLKADNSELSDEKRTATEKARRAQADIDRVEKTASMRVTAVERGNTALHNRFTNSQTQLQQTQEQLKLMIKERDTLKRDLRRLQMNSKSSTSHQHNQEPHAGLPLETTRNRLSVLWQGHGGDRSCVSHASNNSSIRTDATSVSAASGLSSSWETSSISLMGNKKTLRATASESNIQPRVEEDAEEENQSDCHQQLLKEMGISLSTSGDDVYHAPTKKDKSKINIPLKRRTSSVFQKEDDGTGSVSMSLNSFFFMRALRRPGDESSSQSISFQSASASAAGSTITGPWAAAKNTGANLVRRSRTTMAA